MKSSQSKNSKICIVTPEYPPENWGGLARTVHRVSIHARDMGLEVHVVYFTVQTFRVVLLDDNRISESIDGIRIHRIIVGKEQIPATSRELWDCPHTLTLRMMYQSLEILHRQEQFDLFHSFFLYPVGYVTGMLANRYRVPEIVTMVGNDIKKYIFSPEKVATCKSGLETADRVVALSQDMVDMANALTPIRDKARVIFNAVEIPDESWQSDRNQGQPFKIGCAGIFKYAKGLPYLIKAVAALRAKHSVTLELLGHMRKSEQSVYDEIVRATAIGDGIFFKEAVPHNGITEWLESLDVFVLPSVSEGCPNILMEAMATGVPCVATRTGAVEDLMENRISGMLVPWGDSLALEYALQELIEDQESATSIGRAARERMRLFSSTHERQAWSKLYGELIDF
jgi:glycosyltransferase involved in cell wall biosynthesis